MKKLLATSLTVNALLVLLVVILWVTRGGELSTKTSVSAALLNQTPLSLKAVRSASKSAVLVGLSRADVEVLLDSTGKSSSPERASYLLPDDPRLMDQQTLEVTYRNGRLLTSRVETH